MKLAKTFLMVSIVCSVLALSSCGMVDDKGIQSAYKICESHGGLRSLGPVTLTASSECKVVCADDSVFEITSLGKIK
jgi:hypothetical protein